MDYSNLKIPTHAAIIMDGNGRWAKDRGLSRSIGHKEGANTLKKICPYILNKGIKVLSVYAFSTDNFKRSKDEVDFLMNLFITLFKKEADFIYNNNIKVVFSGSKDNLSTSLINIMNELEEKTKNNKNGIFNICLGYGSKEEIVNAAKRLIDDNVSSSDITEDLFNRYLYNDLPPIDLLIRTSGEQRLSNFMLYQAAYAEFYFSTVHFPDFDESEFDKAIVDYTKRDRRFGGINYEKKSN